jgi:hypothetical protein
VPQDIEALRSWLLGPHAFASAHVFCAGNAWYVGWSGFEGANSPELSLLWSGYDCDRLKNVPVVIEETSLVPCSCVKAVCVAASSFGLPLLSASHGLLRDLLLGLTECSQA